MQDGSGDSFQELLKAIASPTSLVEFDTNVFQAALTGKLDVPELAFAANGSTASRSMIVLPMVFNGSVVKMLEWCYCMVPLSHAGVGVETNLISFAPCLVRNSASGVGIEANLISILPPTVQDRAHWYQCGAFSDQH